MKKLLLAGVAVSALTIGHSGHAADLPMKPVIAPVPVPAWSWTGCFVGGQVGWGWQRNKIDQTQFNTVTNGGVLTTFSSASSGDIDSSGAIFGGQVGCDYQFASNWVLGVQGTFLAADINGLSQDPHNGVTQTIRGNPAGLTPGIFGGGSIGVRTRSLASVTGRLGWTGWSWAPRTLFYLRGGGAWVDTQLDMRNSDIGINSTFPSAPIFDTKYSGWTVGGGFEWMFAANWSAFAEAILMPSCARESTSLMYLAFWAESSSISLTRLRMGVIWRWTYFLRANGLILPQKPSFCSASRG